MRVAEIRTHVLAIPHHGRYHWSIGAPAGTNNVLVEVVTDEGIVGYGDAAGIRSAAAVAAVIRDLGHLVVGEDPFHVEHLLRRIYRQGPWSNQRRFANQAIAGVEMALWDIQGKALGRPVRDLLGGPVRDEIPWFAFLQGATPGALADHARQYVSRGFDVLYLKVGIGEEQDVAAVRAVREAVGDGPRLRIDPNEAWDHLTAVRMIRRLAEYHLDWVEQPMDFQDLAGHATLRRQVPVPIALDQAVFTDADVLEVIRHDAADAVVIGFHETGGLLKSAQGGHRGGRRWPAREPARRARRIRALDHRRPAGPCNHSQPEHGHQVMHELFVEDVLVDGLISIEGGRTAVPDRPGLGAEIDWDRVRSSSDCSRRWGNIR